MVTDTPKSRYNSLAIILHWVMAICFILMLGSGLVMTEDGLLEKSMQFTLYQWHKSLGVLLLIAFFLRIAVRLISKPPTLPVNFLKWERMAAHAGHWGLYALMLSIPLAGWAIVSSSSYGLPTIVFGLFEWPHIPNIAGNHDIEEIAEEVHEILAYALMVMIALHVGAVIKHFVKDKINLLPRMWWTKHD
jgi:cytochrome b561